MQSMEMETTPPSSWAQKPQLWWMGTAEQRRWWKTPIWGCYCLLAAGGVLYLRNRSSHKEVAIILEESSSPEEGVVGLTDGNNEASGSAAVKQRYHNSSFPGMNDTTTILECCPARVVVELERHYSQNLPLPFTTLQFDHSNDSMCGSVIESVENYPGCCGLPPGIQDDDGHHWPFGDLTIPQWIEYCVPTNNYYVDDVVPHDTSMTGFTVFYDWCPAYLRWDVRSCVDWIDQVDVTRKEIVQNISLIDGDFTGMVLVSHSKWEHDPDKNQTFIFIPDVYDSCWQIDCSWQDTDSAKCIQFAQQNLVRVTLADYVNTIKHVMCE